MIYPIKSHCPMLAQWTNVDKYGHSTYSTGRQKVGDNDNGIGIFENYKDEKCDSKDLVKQHGDPTE